MSELTSTDPDGTPVAGVAPTGDDFVAALRSAAPYIHLHRGKTFVIAFPGEICLREDTDRLLADIALLSSLGVRIVLALVGVVIGDMLSYGIGWVLHRPIQRRYGQSAAWLRAEAYFARRAAIAVFLTRCVLTPIALPINLVAGGSGYSVGRFALYDAAGELAWLAGYGTLGYVFGSQWEYVSDVVSNASGVLVGLLIAGVGGFALLRWQRGAAASAPSPVPMPEPGLAARLPEE